MKQKAAILLGAAEQDVLVARRSFGDAKIADGRICTDVHSAIEKCLKALIVEAGVDPGVDHNLPGLRDKYEDLYKVDFPDQFDEALEDLDVCRNRTRYQVLKDAPFSREELVRLAIAVFQWTLSLLEKRD